jgi:hypothetical protein
MENAQRREKIASLVQTLPADQRKAMRTLLESAPIEKMDRVFKENLAAVSRTPARNSLTEATVPLLSRNVENLAENVRSSAVSSRFAENDPEIEHILRLSGVKR